MDRRSDLRLLLNHLKMNPMTSYFIQPQRDDERNVRFNATIKLQKLITPSSRCCANVFEENEMTWRLLVTGNLLCESGSRRWVLFKFSEFETYFFMTKSESWASRPRIFTWARCQERLVFVTTASPWNEAASSSGVHLLIGNLACLLKKTQK